MSPTFDAMSAQLAVWARRLGCFELASAYEETRYLGVGGREMRGNLDEQRAEFERFWQAFKSGGQP